MTSPLGILEFQKAIRGGVRPNLFSVTHPWPAANTDLTEPNVAGVAGHLIGEYRETDRSDLESDRFYKLGAAGYSVTGLGLFGLFAIQDYSAWSWEAANAFILNLSAFFWFVFGSLIVIFAYGDYRESVDG